SVDAGIYRARRPVSRRVGRTLSERHTLGWGRVSRWCSWRYGRSRSTKADTDTPISNGSVAMRALFEGRKGLRMKLTKQSLTLLTLIAAITFIAGMLFRCSAQTTSLIIGATTAGDNPTQVEIARAMSAGPPEVAKAARIVGMDAQSKMVILREGTTVSYACREILRLLAN